MPLKRFVSYDGYDLETHAARADLMADDAYGQWSNAVDERGHPGASASIGAVAPTARRIAVEFTFPDGAGAATINAAIQGIQGGLQPDKPYDPHAPRYLVAELADGADTPVRVPAVIEGPLEPTVSGGVNGLRVVFVSQDTAWRLVTPADADLADVTGNHTTVWQTLDLDNDGHARTWPDLNLVVDGAETTGLHKYVRTVAVTNNNDQDIVAEAFLVDLGDTTGWVSAPGGAASNGGNVYVFREGIEQRRSLIGFDTAFSMMWVYVDHLASGESMTLDVVYGGTGAAPLGLTGVYRPGFDNRGEAATLGPGSTTTVLQVAGVSWDTDQWKDGKVHVLDGALGGVERNVTTSGNTTLTVGTAFGSVPADGVGFVVWNSRNDRLIWRTNVNERSDPYRGLWRLNTVDTQPTDIRFDSPGCWEHHLFLENNDEYNQSDYVMLEASGDFDPYAILDADRCGQGVTNLRNAGAADGVAFHSIWPLTFWHFDGRFKNPNGMCEAFFGSREDETRDWTEVRSVTTATDAVTLTDFAAANNALVAETRHLVAALLPIDGASISDVWARDTGSRTSGGAAGTNTFTDGTKTGRWVDGQFDDGTVVVLYGKGAGQRRMVSTSTAAGVVTTVNDWTEALDDTSRYAIVNATLVATLRTKDRWYVERDMGDLTIGTISAQALNYPVSTIVGMDSGASGTNYPYHRLRIGQADRVLFAGLGDTLRLRCAERRALLVNGSTETDVTACVLSEYVRSATDTELTDEWLPMAPGGHALEILNRGMATFDLDADLYLGFLG